MATFLPGVTDVFAGPSAYTPDFNRIERMLRIREGMYQQGAQRVKSLYDSVFNSAVLRDGNTQRRDAYLKTITDSLNKVSAMDLSLVQNQELANNLFTPVLNDKNLVHDISYTKKLQDELSLVESYRTSLDPATKKMYWEPGKKYLEYKAEEFKNADDNTALAMSPPKYIPQVDYVSFAEKAYKEAGISVTQDIVSNQYIWTKKNGDAVFPISQSFVNTLFASDPGIKEMAMVRAYVERKDFVKHNASRFGGEAEAEAFYLNEIIKNAGSKVASEMKATNEEIKALRAKKESWNKVITERGIIPGSDEHMEYLADLDKLDLAEQSLQTKKDNILPPTIIDFNNIDELRNQADNLATFANYNLLTNEVARSLAFKDASLTVKEDPYFMANFRAQLALNNAVILERIRQENRVDILRREIKAGKYKRKAGENEDDDVVTPNDVNGFRFDQNPSADDSEPGTSPYSLNLSEDGQRPILQSTGAKPGKSEKEEEEEKEPPGSGNK